MLREEMKTPAALMFIVLILAISLVSCVTTAVKMFSQLETEGDAFAEKAIHRVLVQVTLEGYSQGTGFMAELPNKRGTVSVVMVTANHVCTHEGMLITKNVIIENGKDLYSGDVVALSSNHDLCFVEVDSRVPRTHVYKVAKTDTGKGAFVGYGFPSVSRLVRYKLRGVGIAQIPYEPGTGDVVYLQDDVFPGQSGGPVVNPVTNEVVGVIQAVDKNYSYAVPAKALLEEARALLP